MEFYQYNQQNVIKGLRSNKKNVFLDTLIRIINNEDFEADFEEVNLEVKKKCNGESLLHRVLKYKDSVTLEFVRKFAGKNPELLKEQRDSKEIAKSEVFRGQSPLHVAIVNGYAEAVEEILKIAAKNNMTQDLLRIPATGKKFKNTVLMGQLPISAAALACKDEDFKVLDILFGEDASRTISIQNSEGDTVFHSLIEYADIHSDQMQHIEPTFKFIWNKFAEHCEKFKFTKVTDILFWENKSGMTPLRLAAKLGVSELFNYLINIEDVYCFQNVKDGLFDIRMYDVTEFDRLISHTENLEDSQKGKISILESVFHSKCTHKEAFQILDQELVKFILDKKWRAYQKLLSLWMVLHIIFMCLFTASTIEKSKIYFLSPNNETSISFEVGIFFTIVAAFLLLGGIIYFFFFLVCISNILRRCPAKPNCYNLGIITHNFDYILSLFITSVCALVEFVLILLKCHCDYHLVFGLIFGWYFTLYFSPFRKETVSFTYMIKTGFLEDFVPFALVYFCLLISFTTIMFIIFRGTDGVEEFDTFGSSLLAMFKLGVGLNDIGMLNQARIPWLAYTLFVVYVIFSFIQLFNALIAVMSQTFSGVHDFRNSYYLYNKLKMIELFEDIVLFRIKSKYPFKCIFKKVKYWYKFDDDTKDEISLVQRSVRTERFKKGKQERPMRFYSTMELDDQENNRDDKEEKKKKMNNIIAEQLLKQRGTKRKTPNFKKSSKTTPEKDIIFVNIQKRNKSSQYPEGTALSNW